MLAGFAKPKQDQLNQAIDKARNQAHVNALASIAHVGTHLEAALKRVTRNNN